ncbi:unnamed protein product [Parajaminaea phylloscopi]
MPRIVNPTGWSFVGDASRAESDCKGGTPLAAFGNSEGHRFWVHPLDERTVRIVHKVPCRPYSVRLREVKLERRAHQGWSVEHDAENSKVTVHSPSRVLCIIIEYKPYIRLTWLWNDGGTKDDTGHATQFLKDFKFAYPYDQISGRVSHYKCSQGYMPLNELQKSVDDQDAPIDGQNEFVYGLGESKGRLNKIDKRYVIDGRDSLGADLRETDPFYKITPFYIHYDAASRFWYGIYYNTLNPSVFDFGAEHDFSTGNFHSFSTEHGPLDYYVLLDTHASQRRSTPPSLPGIVSQFARLVSPASTGPAADRGTGWQASPVLPALNQFGYLASSLTLSEREDAQAAVTEYVAEARRRRFPIDGMHLSSGYCQDEQTGERHYFHWNKHRYPSPAAMGKHLEQEQHCQVVINVKPWLLETHPQYADVASRGAFIRAAEDATDCADRCGSQGQCATWHWSSSMGQTLQGSYFDYSSRPGRAEWQRLVRESVLDNEITGVWIDNNEYSTLLDDKARFAGEDRPWQIRSHEASPDPSDEVSERMAGWQGVVDAGAWGRSTQTMGMAKATFDALLTARPTSRPVIVTRSAVTGMQAFVSGTWSGDNCTTWESLEWSTKLTLSYGLSFGIGVYGHDIGGFAGEHSPSAELLVAWCRQSAWHTRFTVHSWKIISTTLWMYDEKTTHILRKVLDWRYQIIPHLYSTYVTDYFRRGWPVLRPLLWHHSRDRSTLAQDSQFLVGSHILVAPILKPGHTSVTFNLPSVADEGDEACWWYSVTDSRWWAPAEAGATGQTITLGCPDDAATCPYLIRGGGALVRAPSGMTTTRTPTAARYKRLVSIVPAPLEAGAPCGAGHRGHFVIIMDDGESNAATEHGSFTEINIDWRLADAETICVDVSLGVHGFTGRWEITVEILGAPSVRQVAGHATSAGHNVERLSASVVKYYVEVL